MVLVGVGGADVGKRRDRTPSRLISLRLGVAAILAVSLSTAPLFAQTASPAVDTGIPYGSPLGYAAQAAAQSGYGSQQQGTNSANPYDAYNYSNANATAGTGAGAATTIQPDEIGASDTNPLPVGQIGGTSGTTQSGQLLAAQRSELLTPTPRLKPPAKPNEFEQYVAQRLARTLPRFGADLLLPSNRDYAVPATASVPPDYILNVGDMISISLTGSVEGSVNREIDTDGKIFLDKVGSIKLVGVRYGDLHDVIANAIGRQYRGYTVTVSVKQLRGVRVYVTGFANDPGAYTVNSLSTMANAVLAAGGPSAGGSYRSVQLIRHGQVVQDFDLYDLVRKGDRSHDAILQNEDVLFIPPVGAQVAVFGSVNDEAIYELKPGETLDALLRYAGGPNALADQSRVMLYRLSEQDTIGVREVPAVQIATTQGQEGDMVQFLSQGSLVHPLERQAALVRIEGEVDRPGNYYVPANSTLGEVLAKAGGLTPRAFVYGTRIERLSVKQQQQKSFQEALQQLEVSLSAAPLQSGGLGASSTDRAGQLAAAREVLQRLRQAQPDGRIVVDLPVDATTLPERLIVENNDKIVIPPRPDTVGVFGAVYRPASFLMEGKPLRVRDYLIRTGGSLRVGDTGEIFVVRANGDVLPRKHGALNARVYPGDVIFVPVRSQHSSTWDKIKDLSAVVFQFGITAAAIAAINN